MGFPWLSIFKQKSTSAKNEIFFGWDPTEYSVGITRFDQDHKRLAGFVNQVHAALIQDRDRTQASRLMRHLIQETRLHFFQEEAALKDGGYPGLENHLAEHQVLLQEAESLLRQFQAGTISGLAFPTFIKNWLIVHIQESDRNYATCLRRNGER